MADDETLIGSSSDPNPCPICLAPVTQESYLDQCFHKFCYSCIVKWINIVSRGQSCASSSLKCPLCKRENFSIVCGYDGTSFQQHYVGKSLGNSEFFSEAHRYRLKCYYTDPGDLADKLQVSRYWKFRKYVQQNYFLPQWLRRELQSVMQEEDVDIIMHHMLGVIDSLRRDWLKKSSVSTETVQEEFRVLVSSAVRPFLTGVLSLLPDLERYYKSSIPDSIAAAIWFTGTTKKSHAYVTLTDGLIILDHEDPSRASGFHSHYHQYDKINLLVLCHKNLESVSW